MPPKNKPNADSKKSNQSQSTSKKSAVNEPKSPEIADIKAQVDDNEVEVTLTLVYQLLLNIDKKFDTLGTRVSKLETELKTTKGNMKEVEKSQEFVGKQVTDNKTEIASLKAENKKLTTSITSLTTKLEELENRAEKAERRSRSWGVRIFGVPATKEEDTRLVVARLISEYRLNGVASIKEADNLVEHCHRLPVKKKESDSPPQHPGIIVRFFSRFVRQKILKDAKAKINNDNTNDIHMVEDLTRGDHALKRRARTQMKEAYKADQIVYFRDGKLYINHKVVPIE